MTDTEIIDQLFGGTFKMARALNIDPRVVSNWKTRKTGISIGGRYKIRDLARKKRIKLPDDFLNP